MELRTIPLSDIEPDKKNPRKDFGDLRALADSFNLNEMNPGEPINPPVVVKDGSIYRIVDGERRYRAMKMNNLAECRAVVCEGMDEANAMMAMLTTDDKLTLSDVEKSRGVQQMLLLGVDPAKVEKVGKMKKGSHKSVIRAAYAAGEAAKTMTLDQLLVIDEFECDGDREAVARLVEKTDPAAFSAEVANIRRERERAEKIEAFRVACAKAGIGVAESIPDGYFYKTWTYDASQVAEKAKGLSEDAVAVVRYNEVSFYEKRGTQAEQVETPEQAAIRERIDKTRACAERAEESQREWFAEKCRNYLCGSATDALMIGRFFKADGGYTHGERRKKAMWVLGIEDDGAAPEGADWLSAFAFADETVSIVGAVSDIVRGQYVEGARPKALKWLEQLDAYVSDGYETGEDDIAVSDFLADFLQGE